MIKELQAIYTKRKSFYNKAKLYYIDDDIILLLSYDIIIISYEKNDNILQFTDNEDHYTMTTLNHVREFLQRFNFNDLILSIINLILFIDVLTISNLYPNNTMCISGVVNNKYSEYAFINEVIPLCLLFFIMTLLFIIKLDK